MAKICPNCNEQFDDDAVACKYCGRPTERLEEGSSAVMHRHANTTYYYIGAAILLLLVVLILTTVHF
ncbi:zinc ribbon domain-containing protein [Cohnella pontilimi]|nr:zinc ribbon domain-containing protein [Cohnella pontilimi]